MSNTTVRCKLLLRNVLDNLLCLTVLQSEDSAWFLLRALLFTSRTSYTFVVAVARNFVTCMLGLASPLKGKAIKYL